MTIISYAQNYEDIMLWRALKSVKQGFYIDVGANDPDHFSVTKHFYDNGWRGINLEPIPQWFEMLSQKRPRDINLQVAAGTEDGELTMFELPDTGLSTLDEDVAEAHRKTHGFSINKRQVKVERLTDICERLHVGPIHFLKIDVEGAEEFVIRGLDLEHIRPWIIVVESTRPLTQIEDYQSWEELILCHNYSFVYFDGLNRFYVANEHPELKESFHTPPNVFDDFRIHAQVAQEHRANAAEAQVSELRGEVDALQETVNEITLLQQTLATTLQDSRETAHRWWLEASSLKEQLEQANQHYENMRASTSWRLTRPLRGAKLMMFHLRRKELAREHLIDPAKRTLRPILLKAIETSSKFPRIRTAIGRALHLTPNLRRRIVNIGQPPLVAPPPVAFPIKTTARARKIYLDLNKAINDEYERRQQ